MIKLYHESRKKSTLYAFFMHCVDFFSAFYLQGFPAEKFFKNIFVIDRKRGENLL